MVATPVMTTTEAVAALAGKLLWPLAGSILALLVIPPKTRTEAARRGLVAFIGGHIGGPPLHEWLEISSGAENSGFALALAAFISWWVLGALPKVVGRIKSKDE